MPDKEHIISQIILAIWEHPCPAYAGLRKRIQTKAEKLMKWYIAIPADELPVVRDTTERTFGWLY